jgi:predicted phage terminase large subunit-like protein
MRKTPLEWLTRAIQVARTTAPRGLILEKNFGGRALLDVLEQASERSGIRVGHRVVTATTGKLTRAEPVAALYELGKVSHVGLHTELEEQLVNFTGAPGEKSPDRLDALVWAMTELQGYGVCSGDQGRGAIPWRSAAGHVGVGARTARSDERLARHDPVA